MLTAYLLLRELQRWWSACWAQEPVPAAGLSLTDLYDRGADCKRREFLLKQRNLFSVLTNTPPCACRAVGVLLSLWL